MGDNLLTKWTYILRHQADLFFSKIKKSIGCNYDGHFNRFTSKTLRYLVHRPVARREDTTVRRASRYELPLYYACPQTRRASRNEIRRASRNIKLPLYYACPRHVVRRGMEFVVRREISIEECIRRASRNVRRRIISAVRGIMSVEEWSPSCVKECTSIRRALRNDIRRASRNDIRRASSNVRRGMISAVRRGMMSNVWYLSCVEEWFPSCVE